MPSYPLFDWRQENRWRSPEGSELRIWLRLEAPLAEERAWTLEPRSARGALIVHAQGGRSELHAGESLRLEGGTLRYERLAGWMGYRVFFDPTLPWLLGLAIAAVAGLAAHLWGRRP
jgi:cytochrome c biogenesis protein